MAKIVVNKHFNDSSDIVASKFLNLGEIAISNEPGFEGIYIINSNREVVKIGSQGGGGGEVSDDFKEFLKKYYWTSSETKGYVDSFSTDILLSAKTISISEVAKVVASADTKFDTLKEIADWIANDEVSAATLANGIKSINELSAATRLSTIEARLDTYSKTDSHIYLTSTEYANLIANGSANTKEYGVVIFSNTDCYFVYESSDIDSGSTIDVDPATVSGEVMTTSNATIISGDTLDLSEYFDISDEDGMLVFISGSTSGSSGSIDSETGIVTLNNADMLSEEGYTDVLDLSSYAYQDGDDYILPITIGSGTSAATTDETITIDNISSDGEMDLSLQNVTNDDSDILNLSLLNAELDENNNILIIN